MFTHLIIAAAIFFAAVILNDRLASIEINTIRAAQALDARLGMLDSLHVEHLLYLKERAWE